VTVEALAIATAACQVCGQTLQVEWLPWSADHYLETGTTVPDGGYAMLRDEFAAVFIGALGDPRVPDNRHARDILLGIRFELDLYVNYRPVVLLDERLCPLKNRTPADVNFVVFRENTEGVYVGIGGRFKAGTEDEIAIQEEVNTWKGVYRIVRYACDWAREHKRSRVCMADKSNAMPHGHALWQRVFRNVAAEYPELTATHLYIDNLVLQMVRDPSQFDVIVTNNLFGDIVTDLGAQLQGGLGMAASGNVHPGRTSMFEPVHGSAPALAGRNSANPLGATLSAALMLNHLGASDASRLIESAVRDTVLAREGTVDIGGMLGTRECAAAILGRVVAIR
jgi:3-isopropylmalate dehydrogenase